MLTRYEEMGMRGMLIDMPADNSNYQYTLPHRGLVYGHLYRRRKLLCRMNEALDAAMAEEPMIERTKPEQISSVK